MWNKQVREIIIRLQISSLFAEMLEHIFYTFALFRQCPISIFPSSLSGASAVVQQLWPLRFRGSACQCLPQGTAVTFNSISQKDKVSASLPSIFHLPVCRWSVSSSCTRGLLPCKKPCTTGTAVPTPRSSRPCTPWGITVYHPNPTSPLRLVNFHVPSSLQVLIKAGVQQLTQLCPSLLTCTPTSKLRGVRLSTRYAKRGHIFWRRHWILDIISRGKHFQNLNKMMKLCFKVGKLNIFMQTCS